MALSANEKAAKHRAKVAEARLSGPHLACGCGCGEQIPAINSMGQPARFKLGHASRVLPNAGRFALGQAPWNKGKPYPQMRGNTYGRSLKGRPGRIPSAETRARMSAAHRGQMSSMRGRHHTEETKAKLSAKLRGRRLAPVRSGPQNSRWKGGENVQAGGWIRSTISKDEAAQYPTASKTKILRSHLVWDRTHPDDFVQKGEEIHHKNRERADDRIENLVKTTKQEHLKHHWSERRPR